MIYLLTPLFFSIFFNLSEVSRLLRNFSINTNFELFSGMFFEKMSEMRFNDGGQVFFNKILVLVNEIFTAIEYLNPVYYFHSGDGSVLSPQIVEPIAFMLFPFFVLGIISLLKKSIYKYFYLIIFFAFVNYFIRPQNILFLLPIAIIYIYISTLSLNSKFRKIVIVYSLFIMTRFLLI